MIEEAQIQANRENAKLGGVKTEEGKAISKYNALKHGLLSKEVLLADEDEKILIELGKRIRSELKPAGELEVLLADRITANMWRLKRLLKVEAATMERQRQFQLRQELNFEVHQDQIERKAIQDMIANDHIEKLLRYETSIERGVYKALHELQRLQAIRMGERLPAPLVVDVDVSGIKE
jgi:hypothetical protein